MIDINSLVKYTADLPKIVMNISNLQKIISTDNEEKYKEAMKSPEFALLKKYIKGRAVDTDDRHAVGVALMDLKKDISQMEKVRLVLPSQDLSQNFNDKLFDWIKENVMQDRPFLIERQVDPRILGGLVLYLNGRFVDLSLRTKLERFFAKRNLASVLG